MIAVRTCWTVYKKVLVMLAYPSYLQFYESSQDSIIRTLRHEPP
jgi:hypothetical protein